ncbi:MAG TPA: flagellar transcriptional regulator FlhD [Burkholderiaceae bacterium]
MQADDQILEDIRETNMSYLVLAQRLIREDKVNALFRLGIAEETANIIVGLSPAQLMKVAAVNTLLCRFRMDDSMVWNLLTQQNLGKTSNSQTARLHANILMAGNFREAV